MHRAPLLALPALLLTSLAYACDHAGDHWKAADTDNDGKISRAEAESAAPRMAKGFASLDSDKDGQLTAAEMQAARTTGTATVATTCVRSSRQPTRMATMRSTSRKHRSRSRNWPKASAASIPTTTAS